MTGGPGIMAYKESYTVNILFGEKKKFQSQQYIFVKSKFSCNLGTFLTISFALVMESTLTIEQICLQRFVAASESTKVYFFLNFRNRVNFWTGLPEYLTKIH